MSSTEPANTTLAPTERKILGMPVSAIMTAFVGALLGVVGTLVTTWWTAKEPHLIKRVSALIPFQGEKGETGILNASLSNDGSKEAEEVNGFIRVEGSTIEEVKIVPDILQAEKTVKGDTLTVKLKTLNAGETLQVSALVKKSSGLPTTPLAEFRGIGVRAEEKSAAETASSASRLLENVVLILMFAAVAIVVQTLSPQGRMVARIPNVVEAISKSSEQIETLSEVTAYQSKEIRRLAQSVATLEWRLPRSEPQ